MNEILAEIFQFLKANHQHNKALQLVPLKAALLPFFEPKAKVKSLLMDVANTQSSPKMDHLSQFWMAFDKAEQTFDSALSLVQFLESKSPLRDQYPVSQQANLHLADRLFLALRQLPGYGDKTAALFVKSLVLAHLEDAGLGYPAEKIAFLKDGAELTKPAGMKLQLPVDAVIRHIFGAHINRRPGIGGGIIKTDFASINHCLFEFARLQRIPELEALYWDDLWFWGFITQHNGDGERKTRFNQAKYMSLKTATAQSIPQIEADAERFIKILG